MTLGALAADGRPGAVRRGPGIHRRLSAWPLRRRVSVLTAILVLLVALAWTLAGVTQHSLQSALSNQSDRIVPGRVGVDRLQRDLLEEAVAVRGMVIGGTAAVPGDYPRAVADEISQAKVIQPLLAGSPELRAAVRRTEQLASQWRQRVAQPSLALAARGLPAAQIAKLNLASGRRPSFQSVLDSLDVVDAQLARTDTAATRQVLDDSRTLGFAVFLAGAITVLAGLSALVLLRRWVTRPLLALSDGIWLVARGELDREIAAPGPPEIARLAGDMEAMRRRIVEELDSLRAAQEEISRQADELRRSNGDLEQFAYVASHDLQEPLRKVASFCELIERRYSERLDERGKQYVRFAADGAHRMQELVRDVLALARIGRLDRRLTEVDLNDSLRQALTNLSEQVSSAAAIVQSDELPTVIGDPALAVALLQNLIANSIKFRSEEAPRMKIAVRAEDEENWRFTFADNGIGIDPEYADRVFVIFQRLHGREEFTGTGIGLSLSRRIVEFHGGRMWLDTSVTRGATFEWTWPMAIAKAEERKVVSREAIG
ncbi:MAG: multi-sensor signal transduction histidine kinase [Acidimicrobiaceae bacterium]|nr:multi-sensor signal transduction histidine kinase [Acidimicrobiaceae bacterium]